MYRFQIYKIYQKRRNSQKKLRTPQMIHLGKKVHLPKKNQRERRLHLDQYQGQLYYHQNQAQGCC